VELELHNNWTFARRSFEGQALSHLYVAHDNPLPVLLAQARSGHAPLLAAPPLPPPPIAPEPQRTTVASVRRSTSTTSSSNRNRQAAAKPSAAAATAAPQSRLARLNSLRLGGARPAAQTAETEDQTMGVIALQVVPYRP
jgi:hypothetical protein